MSFFIRNKSRQSDGKKSGGKFKRPSSQSEKSTVPSKKRRDLDEEEIPSDSDIDSDEAVGKGDEEWSSSEEEEETAQEKRLRLAKEYLSQVEAEEVDEGEEDESRHDLIAHRLKQDLLEQSGRLHKEVARTYAPPSTEDIRAFRGHQLPLTCLVISPDNKHVFTAGKDCTIIKWCVETGKKVKVIAGGRKGTEDKHLGHTAQVLCMAISTDGKFLVTGDRNNLILVWNPDTLELIHTFRGHRDAISGLAFRKGTHQMFSGSHDRAVKTWNLDEMTYVETLFGHQDVITAIDSLSRERAITSGGRDGSIRIWKIIEESQLVFHGHSGSIDCVALINEEHFISGAEDNSIALWSVMKKKPLVTVKPAHPGTPAEGGCHGDGENWITAVTALQHTDLVASAGSKDGTIRLWQCSLDFRALHPLFSIPVVGFVNGLKFSTDGLWLAAAVGQEHRLGRWWRIKTAKNTLALVSLAKRQEPLPLPEVKATEQKVKDAGKFKRKGGMRQRKTNMKRTKRRSARI